MASGNKCIESGLKCFKLIFEKKNWFHAKAFCESIDDEDDYDGYELGIIKNEEEHELVSTFGSGHWYEHSWIGIKRYADGEFIYSDDDEFVEYVDWHEGEPSGTHAGVAEDCVQLWWNNKYNDAHCYDEKPFVCSKVKGMFIISYKVNPE